VGSATGDFWYENDTGLYYANVFDGTTLGWLQISGIDGVTGPTGPAGQDGAGGGGGTTLAAGAGMTLSTTVAGVGHTLGIDPTAIVHVAGISSDGGITAGGNFINYGAMVQSSGNVNSKYGFTDGNFTWRVTNGNTQVNATITTSGFNADNGFVKAGTYVKASTYVHAGTGISLDAGGITFPDGTFQSTAPTGSTITAGAGMTLAGSTLGIDPTATIHVAGVSSDGGVTASNVHSTGLLSGDNGINLSAGDITVANGARFTSGTNGTIRVASGEVQLLPGNDVAKGLLLGTTIHTHKKITVFEEGISLDAAGITFPDGTFQSTAASASSGGSEFVSSHNILLEYPDNKQYFVDAYTVAPRTYNLLYGKSATGGCTADLFAGGVTLASIDVTPSGASGSFSTVVGAGTEVSMVIRGVTTGVFLEDVRLVAGYTQ